MVVALDTNGLYIVQTGVARYIRGLLRGLDQLPNPGFERFEVAWPVENFGYRQPQRAIKTIYRELFWTKAIGPSLISAAGADVLHSTAGYFIPPPRGVKNVVTLHDLAFFQFPQRFRRWQRWSGRRDLERIPKSDRVICISRFTADEAMREFGLAASKIEVVYNGSDFHPDEPAPAEARPEFDVPDEFFLFVGSLEPGKNLALLRDAYLTAEQAGRFLPPLLVVGARWASVRHEGRAPKNWRYLGRVPDPQLVHLYRRSLALVFPSKYEGFGLPVAEAMGLGCPVVCSRMTSIPEVGGEAAYYAEQTPAAYEAALGEVARNGELRDELIRKGREQAARFSWRRCAEETAAVYRTVG